MYPHARELYSKDVEDDGAEGMAQPKSSGPGVVQTTTASSCSHSHLHFYSNQLRLTSNSEVNFNLIRWMLSSPTSLLTENRF